MSNQSVTGRDNYILAQALACAIEVINRLPPHMQSGSNKDDMEKLLKVIYPNERDRRLLTDDARRQLDYLMRPNE